jgi:anti-anti-sigma regulatory factor
VCSLIVRLSTSCSEEPAPFVLHFIRTDQVAQIAVIGDVRRPQAMTLSACLTALAERGARRLIVDLDRAEVTDRAACGALMRAAAHLESFGATLLLTGVSGRTRTMFASGPYASDAYPHRRRRDHGCAPLARAYRGRR